jgi:acyl-CoA dehydrogenase
VGDDLIDQIFDVLIRDFSRFSLTIYGKPITTEDQQKICLRMIRRPVVDTARYERVWNNHVFALKDAYRMNP